MNLQLCLINQHCINETYQRHILTIIKSHLCASCIKNGGVDDKDGKDKDLKPSEIRKSENRAQEIARASNSFTIQFALMTRVSFVGNILCFQMYFI